MGKFSPPITYANEVHCSGRLDNPALPGSKPGPAPVVCSYAPIRLPAGPEKSLGKPL